MIPCHHGIWKGAVVKALTDQESVRKEAFMVLQDKQLETNELQTELSNLRHQVVSIFGIPQFLRKLRFPLRLRD